MGRYDPLRDYLAGCQSDEVTLSFAEIEALLGQPLPPSAGKYDAWWANAGDSSTTRHSHARAWHDAGYAARADRNAGTVVFRRTASREAPATTVGRSGSGRVDPGEAAANEAPRGGEGQCVALIACSKQKRPYPCPARELYAASGLFALSYEYAKRNADRVYILSAKHGLVGEDEVVAPYDETLNDKTAAERRAWADRVLDRLGRECDLRGDRFILLAGRHYCEYLLPRLSHASLPLGNLPLGRRVAFLQRQLSRPAGEADGPETAALWLHRLFETLPRYNWRSIDEIPFRDGIYVVYERGETYRGRPRIVRVGTHTSPGRLGQRLKDHFIRENHNGSVFRKNIGKAMLNRAQDPYIAIWSLDTSKVPNRGRENKKLEAQIERRVSAYMQRNLSFAAFPVERCEERLRLEEAIIATLHRTADFGPSDGWLGHDSPEREIRESGMWLKQGLNAEPLAPAEKLRLSELVGSAAKRIAMR